MKSSLLLAERVLLLAKTGVNSWLYVARFTTFLRQIDELQFVWLGLREAISIPLHSFVVFFGLFLVLDHERRNRMGSIGVVHSMASITAIVSSYASEQLQEVKMINGVAIIVSALSSLGLLWMVPAASKRYSRIFVCAALTSLFAGIGQLQMSHANLIHSTQMEALLFLTGVVAVVMNSISYLDTWTSFALFASNQRFPTSNNVTHRSGGKTSLKSSAVSYPPMERSLWRAFRKSEFLLHLFPCSSMSPTDYFMDHDNEAIKASYPWILYGVGELGVPLTHVVMVLTNLLRRGHWARIHKFNFALVYNSYAVVTFSITLLLKGKFSVDQFKLLLTTQLFASSLSTVVYAADGDTFLVVAAVLLPIGAVFGGWAYSCSIPKNARAL